MIGCDAVRCAMSGVVNEVVVFLWISPQKVSNLSCYGENSHAWDLECKRGLYTESGRVTFGAAAFTHGRIFITFPSS